MADRPSHFSGFPISDPVIHEERDRYYWSGLYGMNDMELTALVQFGRSWIFAPEIAMKSESIKSLGYDRSRRCYRFENNTGKSTPLTFTIQGSKESPVINPAFHINNWHARGAQVLVNDIEFEKCEIGINQRLEGTDLIVFLWMETESNLRISLMPK
jgi:hypothetical protein